MTLHNKNLKAFTMHFEFQDSAVFVKKQDQYVKVIHDHMRGDGYIPLLDLSPYITVDYKDEKFNYTVTSHGLYVGRKKAWETQGWLNGKLMPISTRTSKSKPSSEASV